MLQVLYSFFVFVEYVEVILIESYVYFLIPEVSDLIGIADLFNGCK